MILLNTIETMLLLGLSCSTIITIYVYIDIHHIICVCITHDNTPVIPNDEAAAIEARAPANKVVEIKQHSITQQRI